TCGADNAPANTSPISVKLRPPCAGKSAVRNAKPSIAEFAKSGNGCEAWMSSARTPPGASTSGTVSMGRRCCAARPATICNACSRPMRVGYEGSAMRVFVVAEIFGCIEIMERAVGIVEIDGQGVARREPAHRRAMFAQGGLRGGAPIIWYRSDAIHREQRLPFAGYGGERTSRAVIRRERIAQPCSKVAWRVRAIHRRGQKPARQRVPVGLQESECRGQSGEWPGMAGM